MAPIESSLVAEDKDIATIVDIGEQQEIEIQ